MHERYTVDPMKRSIGHRQYQNANLPILEQIVSCSRNEHPVSKNRDIVRFTMLKHIISFKFYGD